MTAGHAAHGVAGTLRTLSTNRERSAPESCHRHDSRL